LGETKVDSRRQVRLDVWDALRRVAKPDSRFHLDFGEFIPDFEGSEAALERLLALPLYEGSRFIFITPDNCLEEFRARALRDGKTILVPTYGIRRGFVKLEPGDVPEGNEEYASWLDGMERFGEHVSLAQIKDVGQLDLLVTGGSVINHEGIRFGKGHGFFDLEWAMMYKIGAADTSTPVIAFVHDCQVANIKLQASPFDTVCDLIVTPSRVIEVDGANKPTRGVLWESLAPGMMDDIPPLRELKEMSIG
jgi:5-formyltetrahydrofolate cyclo-ligase